MSMSGGIVRNSAKNSPSKNGFKNGAFRKLRAY